MDVQKFREVIRRRNETHDEYDYGVEMCDCVVFSITMKAKQTSNLILKNCILRI
ncbi:hypothetical protein [Lactobacillus iners]|uniref:hypothetical protein n=1 Tax=Lactobacillus iners TaxID=147802 RepID=UPI0001E98CAC|nr:hypothetical protein [Lactobacillus iners]EFQ47487.1 hypothetical protein HMPREF9216_0866 [Lactobacillus iners LEAF 2053A-b]EFQ49680.1 hypothetical protein HMPREF9218_0176 [Lactobacillus iners LEAF 2062A-h1]MCT7691549.1 hypothetical protein [Lactobacillus iners]